MTSIFSSSWMCRLCGREACSECFAKVRELTQYRPGASDSEIAALQAKRESHAHTNPFFLSCTRRNEHQYSDFSPMSRFDKAELEGVIESMEKLLQDETVQTSGPAVQPASASKGENGVTGAPDGAARASVPVCVLLFWGMFLSLTIPLTEYVSIGSGDDGWRIESSQWCWSCSLFATTCAGITERDCAEWACDCGRPVRNSISHDKDLHHGRLDRRRISKGVATRCTTSHDRPG
jgi:hypothetical protein